MSVSLKSITRGVATKPPKICVYGTGGIGKTTFAASAPNPIFLCTEEGLGSLDVARFEPAKGDPVIRDWATLMGCITALYSEAHDYETVVIDTLDFAEPLLWRHICETVPHEKGHLVDQIEDYGYGKGYIHALTEARNLLQGLEALRNERGMAIVLLAHADVRRHEAPDSDAYDRYQLRLQTRFAALVHDWCDALLFAQWVVHVKKEDKGYRQTRARGIGSGERVMYTEERPAYWAKNRYALPHELPLSWAALMEAMTNGKA